MQELRLKFVLTIFLFFLSPAVLAYGACGRDSLWDPTEVDQGDWRSSENVYIGLIEKAELEFPDGEEPRVYYTLRAEETFKGNPNTTTAIYSGHTINSWNAQVIALDMGSVRIVVGDRLLGFSTIGEPVRIGSCSATRVIERVGAGIDEKSSDTIARLRSWSRSL